MPGRSNQQVGLGRAVAVVTLVSAGLAGVLGLVNEPVADVRVRLQAGIAWKALPLDLDLQALAAMALAGCGAWLVTVTVATAVEAVTGLSWAAVRAVSPLVVRRIVLLSCGAAVSTSALLPPATAAGPAGPGPGERGSVPAAAALAGLPLPDRVSGEPARLSTLEAARPRPDRHGQGTWAAPENRAARNRTAAGGGSGLVTVARAARGAGTYVVRQGDSLWSIAERLLPDAASERQVDRAWRRIHRANRAVIGVDPDLILPGTRLRIPPRVPAPSPHRPGAVGSLPHRKDAS